MKCPADIHTIKRGKEKIIIEEKGHTEDSQGMTVRKEDKITNQRREDLKKKTIGRKHKSDTKMKGLKEEKMTATKE